MKVVWILLVVLYILTDSPSLCEKNGVQMSMHKRNIKPSFRELEIEKHSETGLHIAPLMGGVWAAEYYAQIQVGSPPQNFTVQLDTGSVSMAIPGINCLQYSDTKTPTHTPCLHSGDFYNADHSTTAHPLLCNITRTCTRCRTEKSKSLCTFQLRYGDGSFILGLQMADRMTIAGLSADVIFDVIEKESINFGRASVDGIMGLAYQRLDTHNGDDVFSKLVEQNKIPNLFSMCYTRLGGTFILGGYNTSFNNPDDPVFHYTPLKSEGFYEIQITDFLINHDSLKLPITTYKRTIVDSGTTLLMLPVPIYQAIKSTFLKSYSHLPGVTGSKTLFDNYCYNFPESIRDEFPTFQILLTNEIILTLTPKDYFVLEIVQQFELYCFGFTSVAAEMGIILGDVVLRKYNVVYDRGNKQIGFADLKKCPEPEISISVVEGQNLTFNIGELYEHQIRVFVFYKNGKFPVAGALVYFKVKKGDVELRYDTMMSDEHGVVNLGIVVRSNGSCVIQGVVENNISNSVNILVHGVDVTLVSSGFGTFFIVVGSVLAGLVFIVVVVVLAKKGWKFLQEKKIYRFEALAEVELGEITRSQINALQEDIDNTIVVQADEI